MAHRPSFWLLVLILAALGLLHYLTPQERALFPASPPLLRHAFERILFILPIAGATFALGQVAGLAVLITSVLVMLPRVFLRSPHPADALVEVAAVGLVGYLVVWMIESQAREKRLRQEIASRLGMLNDVARVVASSLDVEEVLHRALDKIIDAIRVEIACVYLLDGDRGELALVAQHGLSPECSREIATCKLGEGLMSQVEQSGKPVVVDDCWHKGGGLCLAGAEGVRSFVAVPLQSGDRVLGVVALADPRPRLFASRDVELLAAIGRQVGVAIENARMHRDVERQLQLEQRLNQVAEKITSELEMDRVLPTVLQIAEELIDADGGFIALFDRQSNRISYPYLHNLPQRLAEVTASEEEGLAWQVMATGCPGVVEDYAAYARAIPAFVQASVTSAVAVPIVSGERSFGTLGVVTLGRAKAFSDRDVAILVSIGRQAGIAIDNARLYQNMRFYARQITRAQEEERRRIARDLHDEAIQTLIAISRRLEALETTITSLPDPTAQHLAELQELVGRTLKGLRRFVQDLRPSTLDHLGLMAALVGSIRDLEASSDVSAEVEVQGEVRRLSPEQELGVFRIFQEALNNIRRHSEATQVAVQVSFLPSKLRMAISDNGCGFEVPGGTDSLVMTGKLGLAGMYERAQLLDGTLVIHSEPGKGTTVIVECPYGLGEGNET